MNFETWLQTEHPDISITSAHAVLALKAEGATVPFIARYRKEQTNSLDEVKIQNVIDSKEKWEEVIHRQKFILGEIEHQKKLTPELKEKILSTFKPELLEDLYLPYKQKRKTKAVLAKEAGLTGLAEWIWNCGHGTDTPIEGQTLELWAFTFRNEARGFADVESVLQGAQDIITERLTEIQELRQKVRTEIFEKGVIQTEKGKKAKDHSKYENYFSYQEAIKSLLIPQNSHRYLAVKRGWTEEELNLSVQGPSEDPEFENRLITSFENEAFTMEDSVGVQILKKAARMAYKVYVFSSIENEVHKALRDVADLASIQVFAENVRKLLLSSPLGSKAVLGVDPGIRTGCKLAVVDDAGKYIASTVMHLNTDANKEKAKTLITEVIKSVNVSAIAVGNGTAGRETETFLRSTLKEAQLSIPVLMVSEAGASVYSASEAAREEFPDLDLTIRGAISIARRLQDPLAELVKIDPKSIGVGQYQHDVSQPALKRSLEQIVESCVNQVGVNLNTASYHLLAYVSGIGPSLAKSVVEYREKNGVFTSRSDLTKIPRFSQKIFEQSAGFLKIPNSLNPLDNTGIHPENYSKLENFSKKIDKKVEDLIGKGVELIKKNPSFKEEVGAFTYEDIIKELEKPGRDPRSEFKIFQFREDIFEVKDLKPDMICPGIVTNVTNFGAFVDIGVHQDGLVHISQLSDQFIKDPKEVVHPGDQVKVRILEVNAEKNQISLSMKKTIEKEYKAQPKKSFNDHPVDRQNKSTQPASFNRGAKSPSLVGSPLSATNSLIKPKGSQVTPKPVIKPKQAFNNPFGSLAALKKDLKPKS